MTLFFGVFLVQGLGSLSLIGLAAASSHESPQHHEPDLADSLQKAKQSPPAQASFGKYMKEYLPPGDSSYTDSFVANNASWRKYMSDYAGKSADYSKYLSEYGGKVANYDQYVSLYSSMAGPQPTSGSDWGSKGSQQLSAFNKSMESTFATYIPGNYGQMAQEGTEGREQGSGGQSSGGNQGGGSGGGGQGGQGGQGQGGSSGEGGGSSGEGGNGGSEDGQEGTGSGSNGQAGKGQVGYEPFARKFVSQYASSEGTHNAFDYEGKEFASGGMSMGDTAQYAEYMDRYAPEWVTDNSQQSEMDRSSPHEDIAMPPTARSDLEEVRREEMQQQLLHQLSEQQQELQLQEQIDWHLQHEALTKRSPERSSSSSSSGSLGSLESARQTLQALQTYRATEAAKAQRLSHSAPSLRQNAAGASSEDSFWRPNLSLWSTKSFWKDHLQAVPGEVLIALTGVFGVIGLVLGFRSRISGASPRHAMEVGLLEMI
eukprot:TRINITY_DN11784_c1_g1_i1.p1 TRINITY_DN11784_c1_g1~~TRINITY_DN11784_c1_g1_i1.p1  ORF type:complete len:485 (+),score=85.94 TRINITY_DN11784_c1_g1_i1:86-1540(+)